MDNTTTATSTTTNNRDPRSDTINNVLPVPMPPRQPRPTPLCVSQVSLTEEDMKYVERLAEEEDVIGIMDFMDKHCIPYDGLGTIEELMERCWLEYRRQKRESPKVTIGQAICESGENDRKKRERLTDMLRHLQEIVSIKDETKKREMVAHFLETEGTTADLEEDCKERITDLQGKECVILVAGETSAGKSSVLNLLFGEEFLPVHPNPCTVTITTIRYGQHGRAKIIYRDKEPYEIDTFDEKGKKEFFDIVMSKQREEHDIKEVQVFFPLWILKSGLVLADTPGIGENEFLERYPMEYIEQNQILGFMYIIMSDHVGGVQEDRLLLLLKMIIEQQKKNKNGLKFDPKSAFFVCNRFDAIPERERSDVKERILEKLGKCWPDFDESSVVFMSTKNALRDIEAHPDYINDDFKALLDGLKKLFGISMDRRIRSSYKWMENVLKRIMHFLKSIVKRLDMSERDRKGRLKESQTKLQKLRTQSDQVITSLRADLQVSIETVCEEVRKYLQRHDVQLRLTALWGPDEIKNIDTESEVTSIDKWTWLKGRIDVAFYDRLCVILDEWDIDDIRINEIEENVIDNIKMELGLLEHEIHQVESDISSSTGSNKDSSASGLRKEYGKTRKLSIIGRNYSFETDSVKLPMKLNIRLLVHGKASRLFRRPKVGEFKENPGKIARERAQKLLNKLLDKKSKSGDDILKDLVTQLFQRPLECLDKLEEKIPNLIQANENLLNDIETARATEMHHLAKYVTMVEESDLLRKHLMDYGEGYIFVHDFKSDEVKVLQESSRGSLVITVRDVPSIVKGSTGDGDSGAVCSPRSLWTVLSPGLVVRDGSEIPVTIRVYLRSSAMENTYQEIAKLRCLIHSEVYLAEFLGIYHVDAATPAFIYSGRLQSVSRFINTCSDPARHFGRILTQTATAIEYLHSKGLVHMELTKDSLTVNEQGDVCATGACLPRKATLPYDTNVPVAEFVYLAPEVLSGELYLAMADHYGFGILLMELVLQKSVFRTEKKSMFKEFQEKINQNGPEAMLLKGLVPFSLTEEALTLVKKCLHKDGRSPDLAAEVKAIHEFRRKSLGGVPPSKILGQSRKERQM